MKIGMSRRVDSEFASSTGGSSSCPFVVTGSGCTLGFVAQLMGGGVDVAATTGIVGVLGNESVVNVQ